MDLRCDSKLHGVVTRPGVIEVKCNSRWCGAAKGTVVLHEFSTQTGELLSTRMFNDPRK